MIRSSSAIVALWLLLSASPAMAAPLPVLFIHGFCSSADTWDDTLPQLSTRRYGFDAPRLYKNANGKAAARTVVRASSRTFRIDFSDLSGGFDLLAVANVPTDRKAGELKVVIDAIKQFTGAPAVILVGHSLGGLAARSYMQGTGQDRNGIPIRYRRDVAALDHDRHAKPGEPTGIRVRLSGAGRMHPGRYRQPARTAAHLRILEGVEPPGVAGLVARALDHLQQYGHR